MVNIREVSAMLIFVSGIDPRVQPSEIMAKAWSDILHHTIESPWAHDYVVRHYRKNDGRQITPGQINEAWHNRPNRHGTNCVTCDASDHYYAGPAIPPNDTYLKARAALGHDLGGVLSQIEQASQKDDAA